MIDRMDELRKLMDHAIQQNNMQLYACLRSEYDYLHEHVSQATMPWIR